MPTSFQVKVLVFKYKIECEGSSTFGEELWYLPECHNNKICIYQSICTFIEQIIDLSKTKKGWTKFAIKPIWNEKKKKRKQKTGNSSFYFKTCSCLGYSNILTSALLIDEKVANARQTKTWSSLLLITFQYFLSSFIT